MFLFSCTKIADVQKSPVGLLLAVMVVLRGADNDFTQNNLRVKVNT